jgi:hypothetical protein
MMNTKNTWYYFFVLLVLLLGNGVAGEGLVSNFTFGVIPAGNDTAWIVGRGDANDGLTRIVLQKEQEAGVREYVSWMFVEKITAVQDRFFSELTGEHRKISSATVHANGKTTLVLPLFRQGKDNFVQTVGLGVSQDDVWEVYAAQESALPAMEQNYGVSSMVAVGDTLGLAFGYGGLAVGIMGNSGLADSLFFWQLRADSSQLVLEQQGEVPTEGTGVTSEYSCRWPVDCDWGWLENSEFVSDSLYASVYALQALEDGSWLVGSQLGLWRLASPALLWGNSVAPVQKLNLGMDSLRVSGIWSRENQVYVESSQRMTEQNQTQSHLWYSADYGSTWEKVIGLDTAGKKVPNLYDSLNVSLNGVAFLGNVAWAGISRIEGTLPGLLKLQGATIVADSLQNSQRDFSQFVLDQNDGLGETEAVITGLSRVPGNTNDWLVASTFGAGIIVSADSGQTWVQVMNRTPVRGGLQEVRCIPSVLRVKGEQSRIAYRLSKDAIIEIDVFSYDMQKVRSITKGFRRADEIRSELPREDFWDGRDENGRFVTLGLYYIRVRSDDGQEAWGKIMWTGGR